MLIEEIIRQYNMLTEGVRITHLEDTVLDQGVDGALFAINQLENLIKNDPANKKFLTIKYDGKPAVVFGRDQNGNLMFTDKPRFVATGYNGRATSEQELQNVLLGRLPANATEDQIAERNRYAVGLSSIWNTIDLAIPKNFRGYIFGDLMWSPNLSRLAMVNDYYVFEPNTVTYRLHKDTDIGKQITAAGINKSVGIAVHQYLPLNETVPQLLESIPQYNKNAGLILFGSEYPGQPDVSLEKDKLDQLKKEINTPANKQALNGLLNSDVLAKMRISDFSNILQSYVNYRVDTGNFRGLGEEFLAWVETNPRLTGPKKENIRMHVEMHQPAFRLLIKIFLALLYFKESLLQQLDSGQHSIQSAIGNQSGGEGYVFGQGDDKLKFIRRFQFSAENRRRYKK